jgi:LPXTG-site transpeptidase (sortase) family protein
MLRRLLAVTAGGLVGFGVYTMVAVSSVAQSTFGTADTAPSTFAGAPALEVPAPSRQIAPAFNATPLRLVISRIGVDAPVEARGLDANRNLATPIDYHDVAWYDLGPRPGEPGNAILNGHVDWWTGTAVFTNLSQLRAGDTIEVVRADGVTVEFKVSSSSVVEAGARVASLFEPSSLPTLTLITCTGAWNPVTQSDTHRLLVRAVLA